MTPDNAGYFHVAYVVAAAVYVGYAISIRQRARTLRRRLNAATSRANELP